MASSSHCRSLLKVLSAVAFFTMVIRVADHVSPKVFAG